MTLVGAGFRQELSGLFAGQQPAVDCAELVANRYLADDGVARPWELDALQGIPVILHGLSGNAASVTGPDPDYLRQIGRLAHHTGAIAYSDHLAFTGAGGGHALGHLAPNVFDDVLLASSVRNIATIDSITGFRVRLENLATTTMVTGSAYTPEEFYTRLVEASDGWDCLLDITNVWINSQNRPLDPVAFIDSIPPSRIRYIHLAGGEWRHGELIDTHSQAVHEEVFELLAYLLERAQPDIIIVERDSNWNGAEDEVRSDLETVRQILADSSVTGAELTPVMAGERGPAADSAASTPDVERESTIGELSPLALAAEV